MHVRSATKSRLGRVAAKSADHPATYYTHQACVADPTRRCARALQDDTLRVHIQRVWTAEFQVYGPRKVWRQLPREGLREPAAPCCGLCVDWGHATQYRADRLNPIRVSMLVDKCDPSLRSAVELPGRKR